MGQPAPVLQKHLILEVWGEDSVRRSYAMKASAHAVAKTDRFLVKVISSPLAVLCQVHAPLRRLKYSALAKSTACMQMDVGNLSSTSILQQERLKLSSSLTWRECACRLAFLDVAVLGSHAAAA